MVKVKGTSFKSALAYIKQIHGESKLPLVLAAMGPPEGEALRVAIPSSWYPFSLYRQLLSVMDQVIGQGNGQLCRACGRFDAEYDLNSIYKIFFQLSNPQFIIGNAALVWRAYYNSGRLEVVRQGQQGVVIRICDMDEYAREVCLEIEGWMERTIELAGGRQIQVRHTQCRCQGASKCEYIVRWE